MTDFDARLAALSPERRAAFEKLLKQKGVDARANQDPIGGRSGPPALSFGQERLWFINRLEPDSASYNVHTILDVPSVGVDVIRRALRAVHERHEILRSRFIEANGRPSVVIDADAAPAITVVSFRQPSELERREALALLAHEEAQRTFDLAMGPTARYHLADLGRDQRALIVTMHHIVADAWSIDVLQRELTELCEAFARGRQSPLSPLPLQYADFAAWQRQRLSGPRLAQELDFWTAKLDGAPASLDLPTDHPRRPDADGSGAFQSISLSPRSSIALRELSRLQGATPFMTLLAALAVLLHRHCGQTDIVVGVPVSGRTRPELETLIGFFIDTVVVRVDLSGNPAFSELLQRVKLSVTEAMAHQELPFERLVSALAPGRHASRAPLFQVMAQWLPDGAFAEGGEGGGAAEPGEVDYGPAQFDLSVDFSESPSGVRALFQYSTTLFEDATMTQMLRRFRQVVDLAVESPARRLSELSILLPSEHRLVSDTWQARPVTPAQTPLVLSAIADIVRRHPDNIALDWYADSITYRELEELSNQLARAIARVGVARGHVVALWCAPSADVVVGMLGILKCGAAYLPLDPVTPADRIRFCLEDARVSAIVTQERFSTGMPFDGPRIVVDEPQAGWRDELRAPLDIGPGAEDLAYVLYTSGSTGRPKGVKISHRSLATFLYASRSRYGVTISDRVLQFASIAFDVSVEEIFMTLTLGATLVIRDQALSSIERFLADVAGRGVTVLDLPTAFWHQVVSTLGRRRDTFPPCVRIVILGGERVLPERVREWADVVKEGVRLLQGYGPTETTIVVTIAELSHTPEVPVIDGEVSIGSPVPGARLYVVDPYGQLVPPGVIGEALVGGDCVSDGYVNRPDLNAVVFLRDPFEPGGRVFRTGDRLRWWPNGELTFHGRVDEQVKIRGFRVEPGEVESALAEHPSVRACAVVVERDPSGSSRLAAFVEPHSNAAPHKEGLRRHLAERLPAYMIPWRFNILDALPVTVTGKVDRVRLVSEPPGSPDPDPLAEIPQTPVEREAAAIWAEALHLDSVGLGANFFDLGGHSLLAVQVISAIGDRLGVALPLRVLFEQPTLADLARHIQQLRDDGVTGQASLPLVPERREDYRAAWGPDGSLQISDTLREQLRRLA